MFTGSNMFCDKWENQARFCTRSKFYASGNCIQVSGNLNQKAVKRVISGKERKEILLCTTGITSRISKSSKILRPTSYLKINDAEIKSYTSRKHMYINRREKAFEILLIVECLNHFIYLLKIPEGSLSFRILYRIFRVFIHEIQPQIKGK